MERQAINWEKIFLTDSSNKKSNLNMDDGLKKTFTKIYQNGH